ncbi:hypothetical protein EMIT0P218_130148 [Pseudomonas sp. IT-P218]
MQEPDNSSKTVAAKEAEAANASGARHKLHPVRSSNLAKLLFGRIYRSVYAAGLGGTAVDQPGRGGR